MNQQLTNSIVDKLNVRDYDMHMRRITNAAPSQNQNDYVTRGELLDLQAKAQATADELEKLKTLLHNLGVI